MNRIKVLILILCLSSVALANTSDLYYFSNTKQQAEYDHLLRNLRCLVCQNENLADSDVPFARNLRGKIYAMIKQGKSKIEIEQFLVENYGVLILLDPPFQKKTFLLWLFPFIILLLGFLLWFQFGQRQKLCQ